MTPTDPVLTAELRVDDVRQLLDAWYGGRGVDHFKAERAARALEDAVTRRMMARDFAAEAPAAALPGAEA